MDFVADQRSDARLFDGRKFRVLTVAAAAAVDNFSRKCLAIQVAHSIKGMDVVEVIEWIRQENGTIPQRIKVDNGSEFIPKLWINVSIITNSLWILPGQGNHPIIRKLNPSMGDFGMSACM